MQDYIARDSAEYADAIVERLILSVDRLVSFPESGRLVPEAFDPKIRELLVQSYRVIYRLKRCGAVLSNHQTSKAGQDAGSLVSRPEARAPSFVWRKAGAMPIRPVQRSMVRSGRSRLDLFLEDSRSIPNQTSSSFPLDNQGTATERTTPLTSLSRPGGQPR
ncbi:MAG: type II toxin-antitoxin system RelE/ParE family toxin [Nitrospira sp. CG24B]|nr:MAG: type II toxin-antitoxin system RelE/ParE family toxin [Nitrospira sp. CG24B]